MKDIIVIGGIKGMVEAAASGQMQAMQTNPAAVSATYSGTGRNIAENLGRIGADAALIAAAGNDFVGKWAKQELAELGVDTANVELIEGQNTAMNVSVLNIIGDLDFAAENTDIFSCVTKKQIEAALPLINESKVVCADGTLSGEVLEYVTEKAQVPLFFDPNTEEDAEKVRDFIGRFHTIKPNRAEASAICGMEILNEDQLKAAGRWFADQGVKRTFITMSGGGVYYKEGETEGIIRPDEVLPFVNEEGAGDAFSAAILDGTVRGMSVEEIAAYGMKASAVAMECKRAVNPEMSRERLEQE